MPTFDDELNEAADALSNNEFEKAIAILKPLVEQSVPGALSLLGVMYQLGEGVERNGPKAVELLQRAAELGDGVAAHNLGTIYGMGMPDVPQDPQLSLRYRQKAKALGAQIASDDFYE